ncbi:MAG: hypothetical protein EYC67_06305 [Betaproteobacteria bacterium]|nr:MAG: hypothetical protein EYC67_06305 [Betaproteobacteria bacterium]
MRNESIWRMRVDNLKRHAHDNRWGRELVKQWAAEGLMDEDPEIQALLRQWPERYTDLGPDEWPDALRPPTRR